MNCEVSPETDVRVPRATGPNSNDRFGLKQQEAEGDEDAHKELDASASPQALRSLHHPQSGEGYEDEAHREGVGEPRPPAAGIEVEAHHRRDDRTGLDRLVDSLSRRDIDHQRGASLQEDLQLPGLREVELREVLLLIQRTEQLQHPFARHPLLSGQVVSDPELRPSDHVLRVDVVAVVHEQPRKGVNQDHPGKEERQVAVQPPAELAEASPST